MKKTIVLFVFLISMSMFSQDLIYFKQEANPVEAKVVEISDSEIKYKKFSNLDGPLYKSSKDIVLRIQYENGETEIYQENFKPQDSPKIRTASKLFLQHSDVENRRNTDGEGVLRIAHNEFSNLTHCILSESEDEADFIVNIQLYKGTMGNRRAKFIITHVATERVIFETGWVRGAPSEFNGFSGTRRSIGKIIKKDLLKKYPEIAKK